MNKTILHAFCIFFLALFFSICEGCGTTTKVLSSDEKTSEEIMSASSDRIARITLDDSTSEFGTHIAINSSRTEWKTASVVRREFNEINVFHATDAWKFTEGSAIHTAIPTNMIKSITIPADRLGTGIIIGGLIGGAIGVGLASMINSSASNLNSGSSSGFNTFLILDALLLAFAGGALGGQIGATHQTMYAR